MDQHHAQEKTEIRPARFASAIRSLALAKLLHFALALCGTFASVAITAANSPPSTQPATAPALLPEVILPPGVDHVTLPLRTTRGFVFTQVKVNGSAPVWFMLDTGVTGMAIDSAFARKLGLKTLARTNVTFENSRSERDIDEVQGLDAGPVHIGRTLATITDFSEISKALRVEQTGALGSDLFRAQPCSLDLRTSELTLYDRKHFVPPAGESLPMHDYEHAQAISVRGTVGSSAAAWFEIDSGSNGGLKLYKPYLKLNPQLVMGIPTLRGSTRDGIGESIAQAAFLPSFEALNHSWSNTIAEFERNDSTMNHHGDAGVFGTDFLRDARLTFDYANEKIWIEWRPPETTDQLVRRLSDPAQADLSGESPFIRAVLQNRPDVVQAMLAKGADAKAVSVRGPSALTMGADNAAIVKALLDHGASPNAGGSNYRNSPLAVAVLHGDLHSVQLLLKAGADLNRKDAEGSTAIFAAAATNRVEVARALIDAGADVHATDLNGDTPLHLAAAGDNAQIAAVLLEHGADANGAPAHPSPIQAAAAHGSANVARLLLEHGVNANSAFGGQPTPLILAARGARTALIQLLLEHGADPALTDENHKTALDYALEVGAGDSLKLLLYHDAKKNAVNHSPTTPQTLLPEVSLPPGQDHVTLHLARAVDTFAVRANVNGVESGWFIIANSTPGIVLDKALSEKLGLKPLTPSNGDSVTAEAKVPVVKIDEFDVGAVHMKSTIATLFDLSVFEKEMGFKLAGIVGSELFRSHPCTLDTCSAELTIYDPAKFVPPTTTPIAIHVSDDSIAIWARGTVGHDGDASFEINTGTNGDLDLYRPYIDLHPESTKGLAVVRGDTVQTDGPHLTEFVHLPSLEALDHVWTDVVTDIEKAGSTVDHGPSAGMIGMGLLAGSKLTFDYGGKRLWIEWPRQSTDQMLKQLGDPHSADLCGTTPLLRALFRKRSDVALALIAAGADANAANHIGTAPLHVAGYDPDVVKALLAHGANANADRPDDDATPLSRAASSGDAESVKLLIGAGADIKKLDSHGRTPLFLAVEGNRPEAVKALLDAGADPATPDPGRRTPLDECAWNDNVEIARLLVDHGAAIDPGTNELGALQSAAASDGRHVAQFLLDRGANVNAASKSGDITALMLAARDHSPALVQLFLAHGADPAMTDSKLKTASDLAVEAMDSDSMKLLFFTTKSAGGGKK
ncbi:MAG TPA: ankyrin repeat domain-containing protein [Tepidisphaeraceae bacterium]|jgi:ankyrin repeat protein|nr:ankyrin repeat domain-containing protein [Tepidisphaeraceae bacterium]